MTDIPFSKFHGFKNDYIVVERTSAIGEDIPHFVRSICARHTGAGADGVALLTKLDGDIADFDCEIINPDGSIATFSGNGTRCAAAYLVKNGLSTGENLRLRTRSGVKSFTLLKSERDIYFDFESEIGKPKFKSSEIPIITARESDAVVNEPIQVDESTYTISAVNVGNPVAVMFVPVFELDWRAIGPKIENHERFPSRVNVVFARIFDRQNIEIRIWERGAGETAASGTCSVGAAVLSALQLRTDRKVSVHSPGGITQVEWRAMDDEVVITGSAEFIYSGQWPSAASLTAKS
ncbi:MAG: diaminopimelate epimerase [Acidobacteria bacterium ACB1]|nr:Diaminopimelate epimerase [Pyrinomonadaceae bacterium]MCE7960900.1 diaminopimelate epimerase [Acidobacteria bacterium ACB1]RIJ93978.1 MAG: diaminopimelate epimerase [Acidobacteriota bacterium]